MSQSVASVVVALLLGGTIAPAYAQDAGATTTRCAVESPPESKRTRPGVGVYFEQDSALPWLGRWGGDQNYTMGLAIPVLSGQWIHDRKLDLPLRGLDCLIGTLTRHNDQLKEGGEDGYQNFTLFLAHTAFTPREINLATPIHDDRPYSSLLFVGMSRLTVNPYSRRALRSELTIGMLGLGIAESVQTWIHTGRREKKGPDAVTPYDPMGWSLQISDGGEPTAKYTVGVTKATSETEFHDVAVTGEASVGYFTNVALGGTLRAGLLRSPFFAHNSNPLSAGNQVLRSGGTEEGEPGVDAKRAAKRFELAGFVSGRLRVVGYNALLQGQFRDTPVRFNSGQISRAVLEAEAGISVGIKACSGLITFARRSAEFTVGQIRAHTFGGVHVMCGGSARGQKK